jgi:CRP-like cAMP-binding protein
MKTNKDTIIEIEDKIVKKLRSRCEKITYSATADLFYEGQIPVVAYLIVSGNIHLMKKKKIKTTLGPGSLLGAKELMLNKNADHTAVIMPQTEVCFLSKSDINEIISGHDPLSDEVTHLLAV